MADIVSQPTLNEKATDVISTPTSMPSGAWVLGHNQKQGTSTIQAGARAILIPSDLTRALSSIKGRVAAQTVLMMGGAGKVINYASIRPYAINEVIKRVLSKDVAHPLIIDPAAGYSPELIWLAEQLPHAQCLEIDLPDVIQDRRERLKDFKLPANLSMEAADLSVTPLHEVLNGRKVDVIIMLATYVTSYQFVETLEYLKSFLAPGGVAVTAFAYQPGIASVARNSMLFRRFAIEPVGAVEDETTIHEIFRQANYEEVGVYKLSDLARDLGKPIAHDIEIIGVGRCK